MQTGTPDLAELETRIQAVIKRITFSDVAKDQPLISTQLLDSIGVVDLVVELEKQFGVTLDVQQVTESEFNTVQQIARKVAEHS
jgi:acyl carrier protein